MVIISWLSAKSTWVVLRVWYGYIGWFIDISNKDNTKSAKLIHNCRRLSYQFKSQSSLQIIIYYCGNESLEGFWNIKCTWSDYAISDTSTINTWPSYVHMYTARFILIGIVVTARTQLCEIHRNFYAKFRSHVDGPIYPHRLCRDSTHYHTKSTVSFNPSFVHLYMAQLLFVVIAQQTIRRNPPSSIHCTNFSYICITISSYNISFTIITSSSGVFYYQLTLLAIVVVACSNDPHEPAKLHATIQPSLFITPVRCYVSHYLSLIITTKTIYPIWFSYMVITIHTCGSQLRSIFFDCL